MAAKIDLEKAERAIREALTKLEQTEKPGVRKGLGTKTEALFAAKDAIVDLLNRGYTAQQIAEAIKNSNAGFAILPKTITQLATKGKPKVSKMPRKARTKKGAEEESQQPRRAAPPQPSPTNKGGFALDSDEI